METIENEAQYLSALERIEELLEFVDDDTPSDDVNAMELDGLVDLVEAYEKSTTLSAWRNLKKKTNENLDNTGHPVLEPAAGAGVGLLRPIKVRGHGRF